MRKSVPTLGVGPTPICRPRDNWVRASGYDRNAHARRAETIRQGRAGLPCPDDDGVIFSREAHSRERSP